MMGFAPAPGPTAEAETPSPQTLRHCLLPIAYELPLPPFLLPFLSKSKKVSPHVKVHLCDFHCPQEAFLSSAIVSLQDPSAQGTFVQVAKDPKCESAQFSCKGNGKSSRQALLFPFFL